MRPAVITLSVALILSGFVNLTPWPASVAMNVLRVIGGCLALTLILLDGRDEK